MTESIYIPTNSVGDFPSSTPFLTFIVCRFCNEGHSDWCEVIPHCSFDLHFSNNEQCGASFHVPVDDMYGLCGPYRLYLEEMSI